MVLYVTSAKVGQKLSLFTNIPPQDQGTFLAREREKGVRTSSGKQKGHLIGLFEVVPPSQPHSWSHDMLVLYVFSRYMRKCEHYELKLHFYDAYLSFPGFVQCKKYI